MFRRYIGTVSQEPILFNTSIKELKLIKISLSTRLTRKNETTETIVQYFFCFLIFTIPCNCKLVCIFSKSLNKPLDYYLWGKIHKLTTGIVTFKEFPVVFPVPSFVGNSVWIFLKKNNKITMLSFCSLNNLSL